jgi:putative CocE/NonD family hydrolase
MRIVDAETGVRGAHHMVPMRDGIRLSTFVYLPHEGQRFPVILQRTPYGITAEHRLGDSDPAHGWLPDPAKPLNGALLRGWRAMAARGYAVVYQDCRGRHDSEGIDRVYADDAADGFDTLAWIADQGWCNGSVGMAGSSAAATTTLAAASMRHPALKCFWAQVGGSSIYDDVVYEGGGIEMERLWLWVAGNIPGLSRSHREMVKARFGLDEAGLGVLIADALAKAKRLEEAKSTEPPFVGSPDWMALPLKGTSAFSVIQPFLDEILSHPVPDAFRAAHDFRKTIDIPGFHATTWYDIFQTSVIAAFRELQARCGNQRLWIGPNAHYFIYETQFWPRDPFFEWFDHWLKGELTSIVNEPAVFYSPRAWVEPAGYVANDWVHAGSWPPTGARTLRLMMTEDGELTGRAVTPDGGAQAIHEHTPHTTPRPERSGSAATLTFRSDPRRAIPSRGGRNMLIEAGPQDQRAVRAMAGYGLIYSSAPQDRSLTLAGPVLVVLKISSDAPDTDVVAKLVEVDRNGRAVLLMDGVTRAMLRDGGCEARPLQPGVPVEVTVSLGHIHHTVAAGHRLEVDIAGSNFPRRARNANSGRLDRAADGEDDLRVATNTLHHDVPDACYVELTILP